jgi:hypothetical protein
LLFCLQVMSNNDTRHRNPILRHNTMTCYPLVRIFSLRLQAGNSSIPTGMATMPSMSLPGGQQVRSSAWRPTVANAGHVCVCHRCLCQRRRMFCATQTRYCVDCGGIESDAVGGGSGVGLGLDAPHISATLLFISHLSLRDVCTAVSLPDIHGHAHWLPAVIIADDAGEKHLALLTNQPSPSSAWGARRARPCVPWELAMSE